MQTARISYTAIMLFVLSCAPAAHNVPPRAAAVAPPKRAWFVPGLELALSNATLLPPEGVPVVTITKTDLWYDGKVIAHVAADPTQGFEAREKPGGNAKDMRIERLVDLLDAMPSQEGERSIVFAVDAQANYRQILEAVITAREANALNVYFLTSNGAGALRTMHIRSPVRSASPQKAFVDRVRAELLSDQGDRPVPVGEQAAHVVAAAHNDDLTPELYFMVVGVSTGFYPKWVGGSLSHDCSQSVPKVVPIAPKDFVALGRCAKTLRSYLPSDPGAVQVGFNKDFQWQVIASTLDALSDAGFATPHFIHVVQ